MPFFGQFSEQIREPLVSRLILEVRRYVIEPLYQFLPGLFTERFVQEIRKSIVHVVLIFFASAFAVREADYAELVRQIAPGFKTVQGRNELPSRQIGPSLRILPRLRAQP